jgi:hypothetical protein
MGSTVALDADKTENQKGQQLSREKARADPTVLRVQLQQVHLLA